MDVVRSKVESLKGSVQLGMKPGQDTTFTIRLPMTLALATGGTVKAVEMTDLARRKCNPPLSRCVWFSALIANTLRSRFRL